MIGPKFYPIHHDIIIDAIKQVSLSELHTRKEVQQMLSNVITEKDVVQFLLKSLYWKTKDQLAWRFNIEAISAQISQVGEEINDRIYTKNCLFIKGGTSNYIKETDLEGIKSIFPAARFSTIKNAGHWVHAENPLSFYEVSKSFLET